MVTVIEQDDRVSVPRERHSVFPIHADLPDAVLALYLMEVEPGVIRILTEPQDALHHAARHLRILLPEFLLELWRDLKRRHVIQSQGQAAAGSRP